MEPSVMFTSTGYLSHQLRKYVFSLFSIFIYSALSFVASAASIEQQAENATFYHATVEAEHAGFTGPGYVNVYNETGSYIEWVVTLPSASQASLNIRFANGGSSRSANLEINGITIQSNFSFPTTGGWNNWQNQGISTHLNQGPNVIRLVSSGSAGGPNYDKLNVIYTPNAPAIDDELTIVVDPLPSAIRSGQPLTIDASESGLTSGDPIQFQWILESAPDYKRNLIQTLSMLDVGYCEANNIGQRIRGYLFVPADGEYQFSVAADSSHQLILNTNGDSPSTNVITSNVGWTGMLSFEENSDQQSVLIYLQQGQPYYFELLHIHDGGPGHVSVAWRKSGEDVYQLLSAEHFASIDEGFSAGATGNLTHEIFSNISTANIQEIRNKLQYSTESSEISLPGTNNATLTFTPPQVGKYTVKLQVQGAGKEKHEKISFFAETPLLNGNAESGESGWTRNAANHSLLSVKNGCGVNASKCFAIEAPSGTYNAGYWQQSVMLKPLTAYRVTAKVRGENIDYADESENNGKPNGVHVKGPSLWVGQWRDAKAALDVNNPGWQTISVEFSTPQRGAMDINLSIGNVSGNFYIDDVQITPANDTITTFESDSVVLYIYNDIVATVGGQQVVQAHVDKISRYIDSIQELSGKPDRLSCTKESAWMAGERNWEINPFGVNGNPIIYIEPQSDVFSSIVWPTTDAIDGIFTHEFTHNFEFNPWKFGGHLSDLIEIYGLDVNNLKRSEGVNGTELLFNAQQWKDYLVTKEGLSSQLNAGCYSPAQGSQKLLKFVYDQGNGWTTIKKIMNDTWTQANLWPEDPYAQYRNWWVLIEKETGYNGWLDDSLHTPAERNGFEATLSSLATIGQLISPNNVPLEQSNFSLAEAALATDAQVGFGDFSRNNVNGQCQLTANGSESFDGFFAHAPSVLTFNLGGKWNTFTVKAALHALSSSGNAIAYVKGDGVVLNTGGTPVQGGATAQEIVVDVRGVNQLELQFDPDNSNANDWTIWLDPVLSRGTPTSGKLVHTTSQKCVSTPGGTANPAAGSAAVLTNNCNEAGAAFELLPNDLLQHSPSGMCMHPSGGSAQPINGTELIFFPDCSDETRLKYSFTQTGSLMHSGGSCIHPQGGAPIPDQDTPLVFWEGCNEERLRFEFE